MGCVNFLSGLPHQTPPSLAREACARSERPNRIFLNASSRLLVAKYVAADRSGAKMRRRQSFFGNLDAERTLARSYGAIADGADADGQNIPVFASPTRRRRHVSPKCTLVTVLSAIRAVQAIIPVRLAAERAE